MKRAHKLKPVNKAWIGLIFIGNGIVAVASGMYGFMESYLYLLGCLILGVVLINIILSVRTGNGAYLVTSLHYLVITAIIWAFADYNWKLLNVLKFTFCFTCFWLLYVGLTRKLKWRKREILELAAYPVNDVANGFTYRPQPVGKAEYDKAEIEKFAKFILKNLIAVPYVEDNRIVFVVTDEKISHLLKLRNDYSEDTYVSFSYDGNISVHIAKQDYLKYKDELSFDKLCTSLGNLFREFLELYMKGEDVRIIDKMNELRLNPFTGGVIGF